MAKQIKLTTRQWKLYDFIKFTSTWENRWVSQKEIVEMNPWHYMGNKDGYKWNETSHDHCATIWSDLNRINMSAEIDKIIITDGNFNYKIAESYEEVKEFAERLYWDKAMAKLSRYGTMMKKAKADGQGKLISNQDKPIDAKSRARRQVEAFVEKYVVADESDEE